MACVLYSGIKVWQVWIAGIYEWVVDMGLEGLHWKKTVFRDFME